MREACALFQGGSQPCPLNPSFAFPRLFWKRSSGPGLAEYSVRSFSGSFAKTHGWHRRYTPFSWYRIAIETGINRPALYRAGLGLLRARVLVVHDGQLAVDPDTSRWGGEPLGAAQPDAPPSLESPNVAGEQRGALPGDNESVAGEQRNRCREATFFRRAKDSSKEKIKKKRKKDPQSVVPWQRFQNGAFSERHHPAGAAKPIPGKYDGISQNR